MLKDYKKYIGKKFVDGGRGPDSYDCWGLAKEIYSTFGMEIKDYHISCFDTFNINNEIQDEKSKKEDWIEIDAPEAPCLVIMNLDETKPDVIQHVGIYVGDGYFIQTLAKTGVILVPITHRYWKNKILGYYKWNNS